MKIGDIIKGFAMIDNDGDTLMVAITEEALEKFAQDECLTDYVIDGQELVVVESLMTIGLRVVPISCEAGQEAILNANL